MTGNFYRLHPETDLVGMVADSKRAVAWLKANAPRYAVDPDRIVVAGGSAGGHLALMTAYTPGHPDLTPQDLQGVDASVRAVVAFYPVVDLQAYMAYNVYRTTKIGPLDLTSPQEVVPLDPIRALHGSPHGSLHGSLAKAVVPSVYVEHPGAEHAFDLVLPRISSLA